jgi:hypothetical protein
VAACLATSLQNLSHIHHVYGNPDKLIGQLLFMNPISINHLLDRSLFGPSLSDLFLSFSFLGYLLARFLRAS